MAADELADRLGTAIPQDRAYHTAAGFVVDRLGHLPEVGRGWIGTKVGDSKFSILMGAG